MSDVIAATDAQATVDRADVDARIADFRTLMRDALAASGRTAGYISTKHGIPRSTAHNWASANYHRCPSKRGQVEAWFIGCGYSAEQVATVIATWENIAEQHRRTPKPPTGAKKSTQIEVEAQIEAEAEKAPAAASPLPRPRERRRNLRRLLQLSSAPAKAVLGMCWVAVLGVMFAAAHISAAAGRPIGPAARARPTAMTTRQWKVTCAELLASVVAIYHILPQRPGWPTHTPATGVTTSLPVDTYATIRPHTPATRTVTGLPSLPVDSLPVDTKVAARPRRRSLGELALAVAAAKLGTVPEAAPNGRGGRSADAQLVQWAYSQAGVLLPGSAFEQSYAGVPVTAQNLRLGDIVLFNDDGRHVGLYAGHGRILHAPEEHGQRRPICYIKPTGPLHSVRRVHLPGDARPQRLLEPWDARQAFTHPSIDEPTNERELAPVAQLRRLRSGAGAIRVPTTGKTAAASTKRPAPPQSARASAPVPTGNRRHSRARRGGRDSLSVYEIQRRIRKEAAVRGRGPGADALDSAG